MGAPCDEQPEDIVCETRIPSTTQSKIVSCLRDFPVSFRVYFPGEDAARDPLPDQVRVGRAPGWKSLRRVRPGAGAKRRVLVKPQSRVLTFLCLLLTAASGAVAQSAATAVALSTGRFSVRSVSGGYGFSIFAIAAGAAASGSGVFTADGAGNIKGEETVNVNGISCHVVLTGTYTMDGDGAGNAILDLTPDAASLAKNCQPLATRFSLALTGGGQQIIMAGQDPFDIATGLATRQ